MIKRKDVQVVRAHEFLSSSKTLRKKTRIFHIDQIIIFHQPRFPWNKGISLTKPPFGVKSCEVVIIWPVPYWSDWLFIKFRYHQSSSRPKKALMGWQTSATGTSQRSHQSCCWIWIHNKTKKNTPSNGWCKKTLRGCFNGTFSLPSTWHSSKRLQLSKPCVFWNQHQILQSSVCCFQL